MTERRPRSARRPPRLPWPRAGLGVLLLATAAGCVTPSASPTASVAPEPTASAPPTDSPTTEPTATPEPELSLALPDEQDLRQVRVTVTPEVAADGNGRIVVVVINLSTERVTELVLRWPTELKETLYLAPFAPSEARVADGGPPLLQDWTKWVEGPGERGEPAGTTSLGWGPLDPRAELTISILVTRRASGALGFDLQVLAGEAILSLESGEPAEVRVSVP